MPNDRDDKRLPAPSQVLFDLLVRIEHLQRMQADTEAMVNGAEDKLARLPYMPWPESRPGPDGPAGLDGLDSSAPSQRPQPERGRRVRAPAPSMDQRMDFGRLHTYVNASAASMRELMAECDRLIAYARERIEAVRGLRMVHADEPPDPNGSAPVAAELPPAELPTDDTAPNDGHQPAAQNRAHTQAEPDAHPRSHRQLDPAKRARAARAARRLIMLRTADEPAIPIDPPHFIVPDVPEDDDIEISAIVQERGKRPGKRPGKQNMTRPPKPDVRAVLMARYQAEQDAAS
ncbi:hypothetical protein [Haliangium sp.]|uniref:hypothetical protein n=1 Tax=Haliangium sp. TaxID=2663208 RepID=UPI003D0B39CA